MSLDERVRDLAAKVPPPPEGDVEGVRARGVRRRRVRHIGVGAGSVVALAAVIAMGVTIAGGGPTVPTIADAPDRGVEQAPDAGMVDAHWPIELRYTQFGGGNVLRFRGNSWEDWSIELEEPNGSWRLVDREHPGEDFETEGGAFLDGGAADEDAGIWRLPGPEVNPGWRGATGLPERVVVDLDDIPGASDLVARLGLELDEVEAYVSPNVLDCDQPLRACIPQGETGARGIAHLPTGFPLYAEEGVASHRTTLWLEAEAIRWADPTIAPVPVEDIPRITPRQG